jgi:hypothetical protein
MKLSILAIIMASFVCTCAADVERPEEIKSKRLVIYSPETYVKLARQWKTYYDAFPSEYSYANWMYAARYADDKDYWELLDKGLEKYPANPTLLYLKGLEHHGERDDIEGRRYMEKAAALDPSYADPWFALIPTYMAAGEEDKIDNALHKILESGIIQDEVMDFCYNIMVSMDNRGIIITNGDNDTYPIWIMQRLLKIRPDVTVLNRSLLNTDWYPIYMIEHGAPVFTDKEEVANIRELIKKWMDDKSFTPPLSGPFCDTLTIELVAKAEQVNRPVYISITDYRSPTLKSMDKTGRSLGLVTLVTKSNKSYADQLRQVYKRWLKEFRTCGLDSWRLQNSPEGDASRQLMVNYTRALAIDLDSLKTYAPDLRLDLFRWFLDHADKSLTEKYRTAIYQRWCEQSDINEIESWCKEKGID